MDEDKKHDTEDTIETNLNIKEFGIKAKDFFSNKKIFNKTTLIILLILVTMICSIYFRTYTETLPKTEDWAESSVISYYKSQIKTQVDSEYPNLPEVNKEDLINKRFAEVYQTEKNNIESSQKSLAAQYREDFQDENNQTYLLAIDPYYYSLKATNLIEDGTVCDEIKEDVCWNTHEVAPKGREMTLDGHTLILFWTYKISNFFKPGTPLLNSIYLIPALIILLGLIPAFFIIKKYAGIVGGFVAAMLVGIHPYLLGRTPAGFVDTDAYGITMPLFIFWFIIEAFSARSYQKKGLFAALAGVATWIFYKTWGGGWYFSFDILIAVLIGMIIYQIIKILIDSKESKKKHIKLFHSRIIRSNLIIFAVYLLVTIIFMSYKVVISTLTSVTRSAGLQNAVHSTLWPNVYTTVAELNTQSLTGITKALASSSLGQTMIFLALLAIPLSLIKVYNKRTWTYLIGSAILYLILTSKSIIAKISPNFYIVLILLTVAIGILVNLFQERKERASILLPALLGALFAGTIFASVRGIRFVLLGINPFSLMIGLTIGILFIKLSKRLHVLFDIPKIATKIIVLILVVIIFVNYFGAAHIVSLNEIPQMNDAWHESLTKIRAESDQKAIITSWWDFGHWFKAVADRAVTFDGVTQNTPMAHWVGKSLVTSNEDLTVGILRMLHCGSNDAFELLNNELNNPALSVAILDEIVQENKEDAKQILLSKGFQTSSVNSILQKTHCNPPEAYYITSGDMVSKSGVWAHFGLWDFKKADLYYNGKSKDFSSFTNLAKIHNYEDSEIEVLFDEINMLQTEKEANTWISGWPGYIGTGSCLNINNTVNCNINVKIGSQNGADLVIEKYIFNKLTEEGEGVLGIYKGTTKVGEDKVSIRSFTTEINNELKTYDSSASGVDISIFNIGNSAVVSSKELSTSIFTRLFYFDGKYTTHFEKFSDLRSQTSNQRIIVWKINWDGNVLSAGPTPVNITIE